MSLIPDTRVLLSDALQPPPGFEIDQAIGATYSLDLQALLMAPMSFALFDYANAADPDLHADPLQLFDAVNRYAKKTTVFCQAGAISIPSSYNRVFTLVENCVQQVQPSAGLFHPKVWALRFKREERFHHRLVVLSRNLTLDRSWDTVLALEESKTGTIDAAPAAGFLRALPRMRVGDSSSRHQQIVDDVAATLQPIRFAPPEGYDAGKLLPLGIGTGTSVPTPQTAQRLLAISPFVTDGPLRSLASVGGSRTLVSRPETLQKLTDNHHLANSILEGWECFVLQPMAEPPAGEIEKETGDNGGEPAQAADETRPRESLGYQDPPSGLHAKVILWDRGDGVSELITGSTNLTRDAWEKNVEFGALLQGPTHEVGVAATLDDDEEQHIIGLAKLLEPFTASDEHNGSQEKFEWAVERFHQKLAAAPLQQLLTMAGEDWVKVQLELECVELQPDPDWETEIWPVGANVDPQPLAQQVSWESAVSAVSPFVAVKTTINSTAPPVTRSCLLKAKLVGTLPDRHRYLMLELLKDPAAVARYLVFLLGDPAYDLLAASLQGEHGRWSSQVKGINYETPLLEPFLRAIGRDDAQLRRVNELIEQLREADKERSDTESARVTEELSQLWELVWAAHQRQWATRHPQEPDDS